MAPENELIYTISVIVVSHGDSKQLVQLLDSIKKYYPNACNLHVTIIENLISDFHLIPNEYPFPLITINNPSPKGFSENVNLGFNNSKGDYFCIINPDVRLTQEVFDSLLESLSSTSIDIIAPYAIDEQGMIQDSFRDVPTLTEIFLRYIGLKSREVVVPTGIRYVYPDWIQGMFMLMRSDVFRSLSGFNEKFRLYFEDVDFCCRAQLSGYEVGVDLECQVAHTAKRKSKRVIKHLIWHMASAIRFFISDVYREYRCR